MIKFQPYKIPEQVEKTEEELTKEEYEGALKHFFVLVSSSLHLRTYY